MHMYNALKAYTKIVKFLIPRSRIQVLGWDYLDCVVKIAYIFKNPGQIANKLDPQ